MSNVTALICELNPLHTGHEYIIKRARDGSNVTVLVMSGNFTQRAAPAVFDKYARAEAAVRCGADLVVELPYPWCSAGVEGFALGGTSIAASLGADRLVFGSESGDDSRIYAAAEIKASPEYKQAVIEAERADRSVGSAEVFDNVMKSLGVKERLGANDKLGAEYIRYGGYAGIKNFTSVKRIAKKSAGDIRGLLFGGADIGALDEIPDCAKTVFSQAHMCSEARYNEILFYYCRIFGADSSDEIVRYSAGVARDSADAEEFIRVLPTKKYTLARIRRTILASIVGADVRPAQKPDFTLLLGATENGREYLSSIRKASEIEIVTKPADAESAMFSCLLRADELYSLCAGLRGGEMMRQKPFVMQNID